MRVLRDTVIAVVIMWVAYQVLFAVVEGAPAPLARSNRRSTPDPVTQLFRSDLTLEWGSRKNPTLYAAQVTEDGLGGCWPATSGRGSDWCWLWELSDGKIIIYERLHGKPNSHPLTWQMHHVGNGVWETCEGEVYRARLRPSLPGEYTLKGHDW